MGKLTSAIAKALVSKKGRAALSQAMVVPIRRALNYTSIGRSIFRVIVEDHIYTPHNVDDVIEGWRDVP